MLHNAPGLVNINLHRATESLVLDVLLEDLERRLDARVEDTLHDGMEALCRWGTARRHLLAGAARVGAGPGRLARSDGERGRCRMETIYRNTIDKGIALIGLPRLAAEEALQRGRDLRHRVHCW